MQCLCECVCVCVSSTANCAMCMDQMLSQNLSSFTSTHTLCLPPPPFPFLFLSRFVTLTLTRTRTHAHTLHDTIGWRRHHCTLVCRHFDLARLQTGVHQQSPPHSVNNSMYSLEMVYIPTFSPRTCAHICITHMYACTSKRVDKMAIYAYTL